MESREAEDASGRDAGNGRKDFFVSYTLADQGWAEWIAWQLEAAGYTTILQAWDVRPGHNRVLTINDALRTADRVLVVLSPDYFKDTFTQAQWATGFHQDPTGMRRQLVPVLVRPCTLEGWLAQIEPLDLTICSNEQKARERLLEGVSAGRVKPAKSPGFPGGDSKGRTRSAKSRRAILQTPGFPGRDSIDKTRWAEAPAKAPKKALKVGMAAGGIVGSGRRHHPRLWRWGAGRVHPALQRRRCDVLSPSVPANGGGSGCVPHTSDR
jgi:hypothetical protein